MNSHNANTDEAITKESVRVETDRSDVRVLRTRLADANTLSIADDYDHGGDPYNSTGQHVIIKLKKESAK
jgi:hypothetical protein